MHIVQFSFNFAAADRKFGDHYLPLDASDIGLDGRAFPSKVDALQAAREASAKLAGPLAPFVLLEVVKACSWCLRREPTSTVNQDGHTSHVCGPCASDYHEWARETESHYEGYDDDHGYADTMSGGCVAIW